MAEADPTRRPDGPPAWLEGPPAEPLDGPDTLAGWLAHAAEAAEGDVGLRFLDRREAATFLSWAEVYDRARRAAGALHRAGVRPGDRVAIILPTKPSFADAFFGCQVLGAVPVALYPPVRLGRLDEYHARTAAMLRVAEARVLVTEPRIGRLLGQTLARYRPPCGVLVDSLLRDAPPLDPEVGTADDLAIVQFSSGTTVTPKAVALSQAAVLAQTASLLAIIRETGPRETRAGVSWLPLYHDMGLIGCIFPALCNPASLTLLPPEAFLARPRLWLRALSRYRGTVSPAPDFAFNLCVERVPDRELADLDLSAWSLALNGAEPVRPATLRAFQDRFGPCGLDPAALTPVYGLSEAALAVTFSAPHRSPRVVSFDRTALARGVAVSAADGLPLASVGTPVPGFTAAIRDTEGRPLPEGHIGRILARGPSLLTRYLGSDTHPVRDGWLDTGDLGFVHDGELFIAGRAKDVIILRGRNHAPQEIEHALDDVEGLRTGCAVAVGDVDEDGERLIVFAEVRAPRDGLAEDARGAIKAATGLDPALVLLLEAGTLPRTSSGKLRRAESLRRWKAGTLTPPDQVSPWRLAGALARSALGRLGWTLGEDG